MCWMELDGPGKPLNVMSRSNQTREPREPIRDPNWVFNFGKYKGETISVVLACDHQYVNWLMENTDFDVHCDLLDEIESRYQEGMRALFGHAALND